MCFNDPGAQSPGAWRPDHGRVRLCDGYRKGGEGERAIVALPAARGIQGRRVGGGNREACRSLVRAARRWLFRRKVEFQVPLQISAQFGLHLGMDRPLLRSQECVQVFPRPDEEFSGFPKGATEDGSELRLHVPDDDSGLGTLIG